MLGNEFPDDRYKLVRNSHHRLSLILKSGFILSYGFCFRLLLVMIENSADPLLVPSCWQPILTDL